MLSALSVARITRLPYLRRILRRPVARLLRRRPLDRVPHQRLERRVLPCNSVVAVLQIDERALFRCPYPTRKRASDTRITPATGITAGEVLVDRFEVGAQQRNQPLRFFINRAEVRTIDELEDTAKTLGP